MNKHNLLYYNLCIYGHLTIYIYIFYIIYNLSTVATATASQASCHDLQVLF